MWIFSYVNSFNQYSFICDLGLWTLILFTIYWTIVCLDPFFHVHWSLLCWTNTHCERLSSTCRFSFSFFFSFFNWSWIFYTFFFLNTRHCWCPNFYWCWIIIITMCIFLLMSCQHVAGGRSLCRDENNKCVFIFRILECVLFLSFLSFHTCV